MNSLKPRVFFIFIFSVVCVCSLLYEITNYYGNQTADSFLSKKRHKSDESESLSHSNTKQQAAIVSLRPNFNRLGKNTLKFATNSNGSFGQTMELQTRMETLNTTEAAKSRPPPIPLIFHQIYKDTSLPAPYGICLYSLLRNHRFRDGRQSRNASAYRGEFDYYFWTDQSIREYREDGSVQKEFAHFESARETVEVSDMLRYFFLYEFGGIYLDLDMEPVHSFLPFVERGYPCVLSEENPIQVNKGFGASFGVTNSIMMCRPRHPFFKLLIDLLPEFKRASHVVHRTGPRFVTKILERYRAADRERDEECAKDATARDDCIFIAPAHIFETLHNINTHPFKDICRNRLRGASAEDIARDNVLKYCRDYIAGIERLGTAAELANNSERLAVHHYLHMGYRTGSDRNCAANTFDLRNLLRGYWMYKKSKGFTYEPSGLE